MSTVRLLEFSCTYAVNNTNDTVELVHGDVSRAIEQMKCRDDAFVPTPVPKRDGSSAACTWRESCDIQITEPQDRH
uniref:DUF4333 domain-containing protein n=1 Tax=Haemonchus contortus TaxID=6289 RepID=A0A7I4YVL0_HAECO